MPLDAGQARSALPALFLAAALVLVWPLALNPMGVAYPPGSAHNDLLVSHLPNAQYARRWLWETGELPLWNAQLLGGQPFAADPLAGLWYPPAWVLLLPRIDQVLAFNLLAVLHMAWGGLGAYRLLRAEGVASGPAVLGGLAWTGAPKVVAHYGAGHVGLVMAVAWTSWLLVAARAATERGGRRRGAVAGACLALTFLADVRWAFYAGLLAATYGAWVWLAQRRAADRAGGKPLLAAIVSAVVLAGLLSAVLALPLAEFVRHSNRTALSLKDAAVFSLPWVNLLGLVLRNPGGFHEHMTYVGTVTLLVALAGLGRSTLFWIAAAVLVAAFALGENFVLFPALFRLVPGLGLLRVPPRAWFVVGLALCVLAGHGAQRLVDWWPRLQARYARVRLRLPAASTALVVIAAAGVLDLARFNGTLLEMRPVPALVPAAAWIASQPGLFRVYSPSYSLPAGDGLEHVDGVDPLQLAQTVDFLERATGVIALGYTVTMPAFDHGPPAVSNRGIAMDTNALGLLNVRYVASEFPAEGEALRLVATFGSTYVYENEKARPRAWAEPEGSADLILWTPNRIQVRASGPGRVVVSEVVYPGWRATLDGQPAEIKAAHELLRSVDLPPGSHVVEFEFAPASAYSGAALSLCGLIVLGAMLWRRP